MAEIRKSAAFTIEKADDEQQIVIGWASVVEEGGRPVVDRQGDVISPAEVERAVNTFMKGDRRLGLSHARDGNGQKIEVGRVIGGIVTTADVRKALGIATDRVGWLAVVYVPDPTIFAAVKSGRLGMFSIGGSGERIPVEIEA